MQVSTQLALGTVQFGLRYGIARPDAAVPETEVRRILARAPSLGIRILDTAAAYGDIESRLAGLLQGANFRVVTKLPPKPAGLMASDLDAWVAASLQSSHERLGDYLHAVMLHRAEDLLEEHSERLWRRCADWAALHGCKLGVSCYDTNTLNQIAARFPIAIAQLPGNVFDQRIRTEPVISDRIEIHLRSSFLQGLLLMPEALAAERIPRAAVALARWHGWLRDRGLDPLTAALGIVKGLPGISQVVIGVEGVAQLEEIAEAWTSAPILSAEHLALTDLNVIDPRRWPAQS